MGNLEWIELSCALVIWWGASDSAITETEQWKIYSSRKGKMELNIIWWWIDNMTASHYESLSSRLAFFIRTIIQFSLPLLFFVLNDIWSELGWYLRGTSLASFTYSWGGRRGMRFDVFTFNKAKNKASIRCHPPGAAFFVIVTVLAGMEEGEANDT